MPKKLKRFLIARILFMIWLSFVSGVFEAIGASLAGGYFTIIVWGLRVVFILAACAFAWRFYTGIYRDGDLLFDGVT
jgi:hypothetical protein